MTLLAGFAFVAAGFQAACIAGTQTNAASHHAAPLRARPLLGMDIEDDDGRHMGKLRDFAFNANDGKVLYAIVASGGMLGVRTKLRAVPPGVLSTATAKRNTLAFHASTERWHESPTFKASDITSLAKPNRIRQIYRFYGRQPPDLAGSRLSPTDNSSKVPATSKPVEMMLLSDIVGANVFDADNVRVGTVTDVLIAFDEDHSAFVIFPSGKPLKARGRHCAVRLQAVTRISDEELRLPLTHAAMQHAKDFSKVSWEQTGDDADSVVFRYSLAE